MRRYLLSFFVTLGCVRVEVAWGLIRCCNFPSHREEVTPLCGVECESQAWEEKMGSLSLSFYDSAPTLEFSGRT